MKGFFGVVVLQFIFLTLSLATRDIISFASDYDVAKKVFSSTNNMESLAFYVPNVEARRVGPRVVSDETSPHPSFSRANIGTKRLVPSGPSNATSPPSPSFSITDIGTKRLVPSGPSNATSPPSPSFSITDIGTKRLVPSGPSNATSPPSPSFSITDIGT
ncbi:unnamed protein product, partial [Arabidopsis halleri]